MRTIPVLLVAFLSLSAATARAEDRSVGHVPLPYRFSGALPNGGWDYLRMPNGNVGYFNVNWNQYTSFVPAGKGLYARLCVTFTDYGVSSDNLQLQLLAPYAGTTYAIVWNNFGNTWSGEGLDHAVCGDSWFAISNATTNFLSTCGSGWASACYVRASTTNSSGLHAYGLEIKDLWIELSAR